MIVEAPQVWQQDGHTIWSAAVHGSTTDRLWFTVPEECHEMVSSLADAGLLSLLLPAMRQGVGLRVEGPVSTDLYSGLDLIQELVCQTFPVYHRIPVECTDFNASVVRAPGVAMGFSGGVDSFAALIQHHLDPAPGVRRLTHLLFNNVGSHGAGENGGRVFRTRLARASAATEAVGLPLIAVDSNVDDHFLLGEAYPMTAFHQTAFMRNAAAAHVLADGIGTWLYSASAALDVIGIHPWKSSSRMEPFSMPHLSSARLTTRTTGHESRVEKTRMVAGLPSDLRQFLDVCISEQHGPSTNCSRCEKCMRTMLTLEILGQAGSFIPGVFRPWRDGDRTAYMTEVLAAPENALHAEMIREADRRNWRWPAAVTARAGALKWGRRGASAGRTMRRVLRSLNANSLRHPSRAARRA